MSAAFPAIAYVLPTRNRPGVLWETLACLASLPPHDAVVVVVDNASDAPVRLPSGLNNGLRVRVVRRERNEGAAGRNAGVLAVDAGVEWVVMLDDDSSPLDLGHLAALASAPAGVAAVGAEIFLSEDEPAARATGPRPFDRAAGSPRRESGGLPEVIIGCGAALRRDAFLDVGGYDGAFNYYAEEYDLCAKLLLGGWRVALDRRFRVRHRKVAAGRDMDLILGRLVRNNGWVMQRYAPARRRLRDIDEVVRRYGGIARKEGAVAGYARGYRELMLTLRSQPRRAMDRAAWDRFTGKAAARAGLQRAWRERQFRSAALVECGKNTRQIRECLDELGVRVVENPDAADALVIGTLSPGPMLDAWDRRGRDGRVIAPWPELIEQGAAAERRRSALRA